MQKPVKEGQEERVDLDLEQTNCEVCGGSDREDRLLLCDGCDAGWDGYYSTKWPFLMPGEKQEAEEPQTINSHVSCSLAVHNISAFLAKQSRVAAVNNIFS